ncbi:MAG: AMP-binding protein [Thermodesulfobacteriota bacterium]
MSRLLNATLGALPDLMAAQNPDNEALVDLVTGQSLSYADFSRETDQLARGLIALGLKPGSHLALWGGSTITWLLTQYAAAKIGAVIVSADPNADAGQMAYLLEQSDAETLVAIGGYQNRRFSDIVLQLCPELASEGGKSPKPRRFPYLKNLILADRDAPPGFRPWATLKDLGDQVSREALARRKEAVKPSDVTLISYTSGTTGAPKGVMCTHYGLINTSLQSALIQEIGPDDRAGLCVPLYHMFGNTCAVLPQLLEGGAVVLLGQYFETEAALRGLAEGRCTVIYGAPSQFIALMEQPLFGRVDTSSLRGGIMGGAPCPLEVMKKVVEVMGVKRVLVGYGQTEASSWITLTRPDDPLEVRVSTIGRPLDQVEIKIVDPRTGETVRPGEAGELCARGFLMAGYYKMPAATAGAIDAQDWLHTGDLVWLDQDGNYRFTGRIKDMISSGEAEISPVEVEEVLYAHPQVMVAAVFGLNDQEGRNRIAAWLKVRAGTDLTEEAVRDFCLKRLPAASVPDIIHFTETFPMTATGKIQKFKMREITLELLAGKG